MKAQHILSYGICAVMLVFTFAACQGPTGPAGPQGPQGPKGDPGNSGGSGSNGGGGSVTLAHVHIWDEWVVTPEPTANTNGSERKICSGCSTSETRTIPSGSIIVRDLTEWNSALTAIRTGSNDKSYTICILGDISGMTPVYTAPTNNTTGFGMVTGLTVTLRGKGVLIKSASGGSIFRLGSGQKLIIDGGLTLQPTGGGDSIVYVQTGGILELKDGTLTGNSISGSSYSGGGGVYVGNGGSFTMNGGEITGNRSNGSGGGVYVDDGGTFTMGGGIISSNLSGSTSSGYSYGGGVYVDDGTFTMNGGEIGGNLASIGGGVCVSGTFTMNGGVITGNNTNNYNGGGVYVSGGTFRIANGTLYRNSANVGAELYLSSAVAAEYGKFSGLKWLRIGYLITTSNTIRVVNGVLQ